MNKKWIWSGVALVVVGGGVFYKLQKPKDVGGITYKIYNVKKGKIEVNILSTGTVAPENRVDIKPPIAGRVEKVLVEEGNVVKKGQIIAWMSSSERASLLDAASARGPDEIKKWEELYKPTPILAPINGMIILKSVESGQTFATTDSILSMSDRLTVKGQVDETDIAQIKLKQKAIIVLDAYPGQSIPSSVDQIAYDAKTVNNVTTYTVDVLPDGKAPEYMRSGMTANVTFQVNSKSDILIVPTDAVKMLNGHSSVNVPAANPDDKPIETEIETGVTDGKRIEVVSGLTEGQAILTPEIKFDPTSKKQNPMSPFGGPPQPKKR